MAASYITSQGRITIPVEIRKRMGVHSGDRIDFVEIEPGKFAIVAARCSVKELRGLFRDKHRKAVSINAMHVAIVKRAQESR